MGPGKPNGPAGPDGPVDPVAPVEPVLPVRPEIGIVINSINEFGFTLITGQLTRLLNLLPIHSAMLVAHNARVAVLELETLFVKLNYH